MAHQLKLASMGLAIALSTASMVPISTAANAGGYRERTIIVTPVEHRRFNRQYRYDRKMRRAERRAERRAWRRAEKRAERRAWRRAERRHARRHHRHPAPRYYYKKDKRIGPGTVAAGIGALILGLVIADAVHDRHH